MTAAADYVTSLIFELENFKDSFGNLTSNLVDLGGYFVIFCGPPPGFRNLTSNLVDLGGYFAVK